jgi:hypothetical protein
MRVVAFVLLLVAGHSVFGDTAPAQAPAATTPPNGNAVTIRTTPPWWSNTEFDRKVTLVINSVDLDAAIDALGRAANISLVASGGSRSKKKVTLNLRNAPLRDVMLALADLYGLSWFRTGEVYTLTYVTAAQKAVGPSLSRLRAPSLKPLQDTPRVYKPRTYRRRTR